MGRNSASPRHHWPAPMATPAPQIHTKQYGTPTRESGTSTGCACMYGHEQDGGTGRMVRATPTPVHARSTEHRWRDDDSCRNRYRTSSGEQPAASNSSRMRRPSGLLKNCPGAGGVRLQLPHTTRSPGRTAGTHLGRSYMEPAALGCIRAPDSSYGSRRMDTGSVDRWHLCVTSGAASGQVGTSRGRRSCVGNHHWSTTVVLPLRDH